MTDIKAAFNIMDEVKSGFVLKTNADNPNEYFLFEDAHEYANCSFTELVRMGFTPFLNDDTLPVEREP